MTEGSGRRYTFRGNVSDGRHGWIRLTPAYSVQLVRELLETRVDGDGPVLDPFAGTGTTLIACAERGLDCDGVDLNPFLVWLVRAKAARYDSTHVATATALVERMARATRRSKTAKWTPELHRIEKWWSPNTLHGLAAAFHELGRAEATTRPIDLATVAFCRTLIRTANVSFGHQSMSFKRQAATEERGVGEVLQRELEPLASSALTALRRARCRAFQGDARSLHERLEAKRYTTVITSPPYPNRMSYIRELRPYMYWLGYLNDRRGAGELDWKIIGGTWGSATSRLAQWQPTARRPSLVGVEQAARAIDQQSPLLGQYVRKYFHDMDEHVVSLKRVLARGARVHYVIGNSKFYDVVLPAEQLLGQQLERHGFADITIEALRKRTSKRELFEYLVSARLR